MRPPHLERFATLVCFNPRICKRCDYANDVPDSDKDVSIHASVKDATFRNVNAYQRYLVSIHASVKDATITLGYYGNVRLFQSTHL